VFEEVLVKRNYLLTSSSQSAFVKRFGVSDDAFQKALQAPETTKAVAQYARLAKQYRIDAVPAVVFNGNQLVTVGTPPERTAEVLDYLLSKYKRGGRPGNRNRSGQP
jgi:thiol:disulfide interchange protein DsbA